MSNTNTEAQGIPSISSPPFQELVHFRRTGQQIGSKLAAKITDSDDGRDADTLRLLAAERELALVISNAGCSARSASELVGLFEGLGEGSGEPWLVLSLSASRVVAPVLLSRFGTAAQRRTYLSTAKRDQRVWALSLAEADGGERLPSIEMPRARRVIDGWMINGISRNVLNGPVAEQMLVTAMTSMGRTMFVVPLQAAKAVVRRHPQPMVTHGYPIADVEFDATLLPSAAMFGDVGSALQDVTPRLTIWYRVLATAGSLGVLRLLSRRVREVAATAQVVGEPALHSQSIRARLVDCESQIELAAGLLYATAEFMQNEDRRALEVGAQTELCVRHVTQLVSGAVNEIAGLNGEMSLLSVLRDLQLTNSFGCSNEALHGVVADAEFRSADAKYISNK